ncbi:protein of unknown function [Alkalibacterium subtropicum]|uniref:Transcobalamin-like C-terminal domain-containing protein n=1 Tax=Alkalibacterium subtropicum TaxID=753702 RepID=A0A1I1FG46_9LACT|nr:DUF4430 domain-containing protein [Alkalibacterium subtropicum]SFB98254.1 protein of unknown function [Alkalibacterium subtropicum]
MKNKQKSLIAIGVGIILVVLALVFNGMFTDDPADPAGPVTSDETNEVNIVIYADEEEIANESFEVDPDTTLMEIMEENFDVTVSDEGFVEAIEGYEQNPDENLWWIFEANDEMVEEAADEFIPEDGDVVIWALTAF